MFEESIKKIIGEINSNLKLSFVDNACNNRLGFN